VGELEAEPDPKLGAGLHPRVQLQGRPEHFQSARDLPHPHGR
jgi:hypothetical protein